ncbi:MAG TPA: CoA transferase [Chloroflexota bacterium]|jgi:crotonobetainyl-CoA:carnitine CoA-transferase CaiB-like acyl-CoA transferase
MASRGPLAGVRVFELGGLIAGPFCGHLLADYGAEVIKVEQPGEGDLMRQWGGLYKGLGLYWPILARNKQAITLDLRRPEGQALFRQLAARADVVVENFRPGTLERWGLGYDALSTANPGLILVRVTGYGQTGPYRDKAGFGAIGEAMGGLRYLTGEPGRPPVRVGVSLGDAMAATMGCMGALLALYARDGRQGSGRGQVVDVAIYEAVWAYMESILPEWTKLGTVRERTGSVLPGVAPSNVYPTRDGEWVLIAANADAVFRRLADAVGRPEWAADPRFTTHHARGEHQTLLDDLIAQWTSERAAADVLAAMDGAGVPAGRIYTARDIAQDPHYAARGMIVEQHQPSLGEAVPMPGVVPKLSATPGTLHAPAPALGEHNAAVYGGLLGLAPAEIAHLAAEGVI